jgi:hypothetical protein
MFSLGLINLIDAEVLAFTGADGLDGTAWDGAEGAWAEVVTGIG